MRYFITKFEFRLIDGSRKPSVNNIRKIIENFLKRKYWFLKLPRFYRLEKKKFKGKKVSIRFGL